MFVCVTVLGQELRGVLWERWCLSWTLEEGTLGAALPCSGSPAIASFKTVSELSFSEDFYSLFWLHRMTCGILIH